MTKALLDNAWVHACHQCQRRVRVAQAMNVDGYWLDITQLRRLVVVPDALLEGMRKPLRVQWVTGTTAFGIRGPGTFRKDKTEVPPFRSSLEPFLVLALLVRSESVDRASVPLYDSGLAGLRGRDDDRAALLVYPRLSTHDQTGVVEIDIFPAEAEQPSAPKSGHCDE